MSGGWREGTSGKAGEGKEGERMWDVMIDEHGDRTGVWSRWLYLYSQRGEAFVSYAMPISCFSICTAFTQPRLLLIPPRPLSLPRLASKTTLFSLYSLAHYPRNATRHAGIPRPNANAHQTTHSVRLSNPPQPTQDAFHLALLERVDFQAADEWSGLQPLQPKRDLMRLGLLEHKDMLPTNPIPKRSPQHM